MQKNIFLVYLNVGVNIVEPNWEWCQETVYCTFLTSHPKQTDSCPTFIRLELSQIFERISIKQKIRIIKKFHLFIHITCNHTPRLNINKVKFKINSTGVTLFDKQITKQLNDSDLLQVQTENYKLKLARCMFLCIHIK